MNTGDIRVYVQRRLEDAWTDYYWNTQVRPGSEQERQAMLCWNTWHTLNELLREGSSVEQAVKQAQAVFDRELASETAQEVLQAFLLQAGVTNHTQEDERC